jgi:broad specificity phosphatase PhoE
LLVRHGESTWNAERRIQGQLDPPLTELGREQARRVAARFRGRGAAALYASDLCRASQTAEPVEKVLEMEAVLTKELREIALGAWEGRTREELIAEFPEVWSAWAREPDWDLVPGGEGAERFERRVRAVLADLLDRHQGGDVVVVTHGGVIQTALAGVVGRRTRGVFPFVIHNASLTVLQRFGGRTVVTVVNDTCHLAS